MRCRSLSPHLIWSLAAAAVVAALPASAQGARYSQRRINEFAAACESAEVALSGLRGSPRPGEAHPRFVARIRSYFSALDQAVLETAPLRSPTGTEDVSPANRRAWAQIALLAGRLPAQAREARAAWDAYPRLKTKARLGPMLARCLGSIHGLLNLLRNARP